MGLHRKHRRLRARMPEFVGLMLLAGTLALGFNWYMEQNRETNWTRTTARVVRMTSPGGGSPGAEAIAARMAPILHYTYSVDGIVYGGSTEPGLIGRTLASVLPGAIMRILNARGIYSVDDLPEEVRRAIREGTSHTFDDLPDDTRQALEGAGFENAEEVRQTLLAVMDAEAATEPSAPPVTAGMTEQSASTELNVAVPGAPLKVTALDESLTVPILYDPSDPGRSIVTDPGSSSAPGIARFVAFLFGAVLTCAYFALAYPWLKQQGF